MLTESCVIFFCCPEPFKALFQRSFIDRQKEREKGEQGMQQNSRQPQPCTIQARTDAKPSKFSPRKHQHPIDQIFLRPCAARIRASSFQCFPRKAILKSQKQLSQHDRCKIPDQRNLKNASPFESTNQRDSTDGVSTVGLLNCQRSRRADWQIRMDLHSSNSFGLESCTDHVEKERVSGKQNSLFPLGSVIKCLLIYEVQIRTRVVLKYC